MLSREVSEASLWTPLKTTPWILSSFFMIPALYTAGDIDFTPGRESMSLLKLGSAGMDESSLT